MKTVRPNAPRRERREIPVPTERTETVDFDLTKISKPNPNGMETARDVSLSFEMSTIVQPKQPPVEEPLATEPEEKKEAPDFNPCSEPATSEKEQTGQTSSKKETSEGVG